jgi:pilus assembly protein CpaB
MVGKTVTLELKPEQAETLTRACQSGTLTLALRSIADVNVVEKPDQQLNRREGLNVIRYGVAIQQTMQK